MKNNRKEIEDKYIFTSEITLNKKTEEVEEIGESAFNLIKSNKKKYIYFENIKINLDPKKSGKNEKIETKFPIKYSIKLETVIKEYLKKISDIALNKLNIKGHNYTKNEIKWVVTVPAIWNEHGKQFMKNCAKKAGMKDILISLEPEAASLNMFDDPYIDNNYKKKDKIFMLIDAGGYTVDITLNQIVDRFRNLKQLSPPSGGSFGSMNINLEIIKIFEKIFGKETFEQFQMKKTNEWGKLKERIEEIKIGICIDKVDSNVFEFDNYFSSWFSKKKEFKIKNETITYDKYKIYIPKSLISNIIIQQVDKTINHVKKLLKKFNTTKIDQFILTGGFSNCHIMKNRLKETFNSTDINQLSNPERSISRGAALFGLKPNQIVSRIAPYTIGLSGYELQREGTECRNEKIIDDVSKCEYFISFITKGEDIKNNLTISQSYIPANDEQDSLGFVLYYSNLEKPVYIDEKSVNEIAQFSIEANETHLPKKERKVLVEMKFSSYITVAAKNVNSGKEVSINANYYDHYDMDD